MEKHRDETIIRVRHKQRRGVRGIEIFGIGVSTKNRRHSVTSDIRLTLLIFGALLALLVFGILLFRVCE